MRYQNGFCVRVLDAGSRIDAQVMSMTSPLTHSCGPLGRGRLERTLLRYGLYIMGSSNVLHGIKLYRRSLGPSASRHFSLEDSCYFRKVKSLGQSVWP